MNKLDLLTAIIFRIADPRSGSATGGTSATLTDTSLREPTGYFDGGVLIIKTSPPQVRTITQWNGASRTFSFDAIDGTVAAGTPYIASGQKYPIDVLERSIWQAFHECGYRMSVDETLITGDERIYTLPPGCEDVRRVEILDDDGKSEINRYWRMHDGKLYFEVKPPADKTVRLHYVRAPVIPSNYTDEIDALIDFEYLTLVACMHALMWRNYKVGRDEPNTTELLNYYMQAVAAAVHRKPQLMPRDPIMARY